MLYHKMLSASASVRKTAFHHPFNQGLLSGKLPVEVYKNFLDQDYLYLKDYSGFLKCISSKMDNHQDREFFDTLSQNACETSYKLHKKYLRVIHPQGFFSDKKQIPQKNSVLRAYTDWQHQLVTYKPPKLAVTGLSACFSLYSYLGEEMKLRPTPDNQFQPWIDCYSSERFLESTRILISYINTWGTELTSVQEQEWINTFLTAINFEVAFWESVYPEAEVSELHMAP